MYVSKKSSFNIFFSFQAVTSFKFFLSCSSITDSMDSSTFSSLVLLRGLDGAPLVLTFCFLLLLFFRLLLPLEVFLEDTEDDVEELVGDGVEFLPSIFDGGGSRMSDFFS